MTTEDTQFTVGKTTFYQGENGTHPLFRIEPGIPCRDAREQSSELMGYVRELTITGLMEEKSMMIWAAHYLSAMTQVLIVATAIAGHLVRALMSVRARMTVSTAIAPTRINCVAVVCFRYSRNAQA
ncbi:hypothetical protein TCK1_3665 [Pseudomonas monteilii]|uniref:DUF3077 domain-containing protein n=1 Tax=Pseudomonas monteilii TaxID=76759 RepID=A0AAE6REJ7_9PSED|nr:hypothetical protein TCK1_3665 [Pseudomonas monteilii]